MRRRLSLFFLCFPILLWAEDFERVQIKNRIKPFGQVRVEQDASLNAHAPTAVVKEAAQDKEKVLSAKAIYEQHCAVCHRSGLAGAPIYRNSQQWKPRLSAKSMDELTSSAVKGINAMPPKGACNACNDDDIRRAIEYMLPQ